MLTPRSSRPIYGMLFLLAVCACGLALAQGAKPATPTTPTAPIVGTTFMDRLKLENAAVRTLPHLPQVGAFSLVIGNPSSGNGGFGVQITAANQAVICPAVGLLGTRTGTIELSVTTVQPSDPAQAQPRVLLDSWPLNGPSRFLLTLQGNKLIFAFTNGSNQTSTLESIVVWSKDSVHTVTIVWDDVDLSLLVDRKVVAKAEKVVMPAQEPLGIVVGNSRDYKSPANLVVSNVRLGNAREPEMPVNAWRQQDVIPNEELSLRMAQGYDRRMYPLLELLRKQGIIEVPFALAQAYSDIGDTARAMQAVTPLSNDEKSPLFTQAIFLRADLYRDALDFNSAYEQLQRLTTPDRPIGTRIRAQVKQAEILYQQGNKADALQLISDLIAGNVNQKEIDDAFILIGMDKFQQGDYQAAFMSFNNVGLAKAPPRQSVPIGESFEVRVADADLNVRIADIGLPVIAIADSGDRKEVILKPAFSRGVYLGSIETVLGAPDPKDPLLHVRGNDKITIKYIDRLSGNDINVERVYAVNLATNAKLIAMAQSGVDVYQEVLDYQKKNILDDNWEIVGTLPKTAGAFFRNADDGTLRRKGYRFDSRQFSNIKAGQSVFAQLTDPDSDISDAPDTVQVEAATQGGQKKIAELVETGAHTGIFTGIVATTSAGEAKPGALEVGKNDAVIVRYQDPTPAAGTSDAVRLVRIAIKTADGAITCNRQIADPTDDDKDRKVLVTAYRVSNEGSLLVTVDDRDLDVSDAADIVKVKMVTPDGTEQVVTLKETGAHTAIFASPVKFTTNKAAAGDNIVTANAGEQITAVYQDEENSSAKPTAREFSFRLNNAENATMTLARQIIETVAPPPGASLTTATPPKITWEETSVLVPGFVYRVTVVDGDVIPTRAGTFTSKVVLKASNGAMTEVPLNGSVDAKLMAATFTGQVYVRLGDTTMPVRAYFSQTGDESMTLLDIKDDEDVGSQNVRLWSFPALNVQGNSTAQAIYTEPLRGDGQKNQPLTMNLRVAADAEYALLNLKGNPLDSVKPGMPFELHVDDANGDLTTQRDTLKVVITTGAKDRLDFTLTETDIHSGIFSGIVQTVYGDAPLADHGADNSTIAVPFNDKILMMYADTVTIAGPAAERVAELPTRPMSEAIGSLMTKVFDEPKFEVETLVRLGESLYAVGAAELKTQKLPANKPRTNDSLQKSARLLQQVIDRFPTSEFMVESMFLTAKVRQEEHKYPEAEKLYTRVIDEYPDSDFVPPALKQLVMLYYEQGNIDRATESAMRLVYGFPKNSLVADAVLKIAEYYYNNKEYMTSAFIYRRLLERFPDIAIADRVSYQMAISYYRAGLAGEPTGYTNAIRFFLEFTEKYKDHELADDALYWAATCYYKQKNIRRAFTLFTKQVITYPDGDMKKFANKKRDEIKAENPMITVEED